MVTIRSSSCSAARFDIALTRARSAAGRGISHRAKHRSTGFQLPQPLAASDRPSMSAVYAAIAEDEVAQQSDFRRCTEGVGSEAVTGRADRAPGPSRLPAKPLLALSCAISLSFGGVCLPASARRLRPPCKQPMARNGLSLLQGGISVRFLMRMSRGMLKIGERRCSP